MQFQWLASYGQEVLPQYPKEGGENRYADIDRDRLERFAVLTSEETPRCLFVVHIPTGGRLIYRQRVETSGGAETRVWLVGCQTTRGGKNSQYVAAIFEDEHIEVVDGWRDDTRWFHSPTLNPHEGESWDF